MTSVRRPPRCPTKQYHAFIVQPSEDFRPNSWQDIPRGYRVIEYRGAKQFRGSADAWRFLHNRAAIGSGDCSRWAICIE